MNGIAFRFGIAVVLGLAVACSNDNAARESNAFAEGASLVEYLTKHHQERSQEPYLRPSEIYEKTPSHQRRAFAREIIRKALQGMGVQGVAELLKASFAIEITDEDWLERLARLEEAALDQLVVKLGSKVNAKSLDTFPTLPIAGLPVVQQGLFANSLPDLDPPAPVPYRPTFSSSAYTQDLALRTEGCTRLENQRSPVLSGFNLYAGMDPIVEYTVPCYAENSEALARLVNAMTNTLSGQEVATTLTYTGAPGRNWTAKSFEELTQALSQMDLVVEVYNARVLVNFLGWSYQDGSQMKAIRQATWFRTEIPDADGNLRSVSAPAEHSEIDFIVRTRDGIRIAGLQWFFGVPNKAYKGTAAFWRPHLYLQAPWAEYINEFVHVLMPSQTKELVPYLAATAHIMRGFQSIYDHFRTPFNSYGLFICSDSAAFVLAKLVEMGVVTPVANRRLTDAFPILYTRNVVEITAQPFSHGHFLDLGAIVESISLQGIFSENSLLSTESMNRYVVPDQELYLDAAAMKTRLQQAFSPEHDGRLSAFEDFKADGLKAIRQ